MEEKNLFSLAEKLWPYNRSITGEGVRKTLAEISHHLPELEVKSFNTGEKVFDWEIPNEWKVSEAYIITPGGERICDFRKNNLHLVSYSVAFEGELSLEELQAHLYSIPEKPDAIPFITSYYEQRWGFCLSHNQRKKLKKGSYSVVVRSKHFKGVLNYAEAYFPGVDKREVLLSTYICHPSMANNELSGPVVSTYLAKYISELKSRRLSYRFIFIPETIGSIAYLSKNYKKLQKAVIAGFNITCIGDNRAFSYLPSRNGSTLSDRICKNVLRYIDPEFISYSWCDRGSDERQYCAPGIDLPIASIMRTKYGAYPEYHTSDDKLGTVVTAEGLSGGYNALKSCLEILEKNFIYVSKLHCEPMLSKRQLYPTLSTGTNHSDVNTLVDTLSYCDGEHDVIAISDKIGQPALKVIESIDLLLSQNLIEQK